MASRSNVNLKQVACVNCCLMTRADQLMCLHGNHRRDVRVRSSIANEPHDAPTAEDREEYFLWLSRNGARAVQ